VAIAFNNSATATGTESDPNPGNNTDSIGNGGSTAPVGVDVGIVKSANVTSVTVGQVFNYTLLVTNHGPGTATGVTVTDPLPANFALIHASTTQGSCSGTTTVICTLGTLANGASATITLQGQVTASGMLNNTATINEADGVVSNNSSVVGLAANVANIPTASEYGLMMLALLLGFAGIVVMRRS
jgi:large repetitive protein